LTIAYEVVVLDARPAPEGFDARFSATAREYRYRIHTAPWPDPFTARFCWYRPGELNIAAMRLGARHLIGEHDFSSFCRRPPDGGTLVRRLERLTVARAGERVEVLARANAFCHQMVRSLVGTLVAVGIGRFAPADVALILQARDRGEAPDLAPAQGLTLERVIYGRRTVLSATDL
jgi:tRNA pseudouridine38-40 synthase